MFHVLPSFIINYFVLHNTIIFTLSFLNYGCLGKIYIYGDNHIFILTKENFFPMHHKRSWLFDNVTFYTEKFFLFIFLFDGVGPEWLMETGALTAVCSPNHKFTSLSE